MGIYARKGERVMDAETGKALCRLKRDVHRYEPVAAGAFHEFAEGEKPFVAGAPLDARCTRESPNGGVQLFVEGEWR